jgi:hypothetical protein
VIGDALTGPRRAIAPACQAVEEPARRIQRGPLEEPLQAEEAEIGPPSADVREWAAGIFREAETMAASERATDAHGQGNGPERHADKAG